MYGFLFQIDFDKWKTEDDEDEEIERAGVADEVSDESMEQPRFNLEKLKKIYLLIYYIWQLIGFSYIFTVLMIKYFKDTEGKDLQKTYDYHPMIIAKYCSFVDFSLKSLSRPPIRLWSKP